MSLASSGTEHAPEAGAGAENQLATGAASCAPAAIGASPLVVGSIKIPKTSANREHAGDRRARGRAICGAHAGTMGTRGEGSVVRRVGASTSTLFRSAALALSLAKAQAGVINNGVDQGLIPPLSSLFSIICLNNRKARPGNGPGRRDSRITAA